MTRGYRAPTAGFSVLHGEQRLEKIPNPAAGQDWSFTAEGGYYWRLNTAFMVFTASAVVTNRQVRLRILDGDGVIAWQGGNGQQYTAGLVWSMGWARLGVDLAPGTSANTNQGFFPDVWIPPSWRIVPATNNLDTTASTGDQWSQVALWFDCIDPETLAHHQEKEQVHA